MCLQVDKKFRTRQEARDYKPLIAEKDILVYKLLTSDNQSTYRRFQFEIGYQYIEDKFSKIISWYHKNFFNGEKRWEIEIYKGLHAFISTKKS